MNSLLIWLWGRLPLPRKSRSTIIWLLSPKYTVGVVGLVRDEQDRILVMRHTYRPQMPWGLPGGGLHTGETLEDCLLREVKEEAGIDVEIGRLLSAASHTDRKLVDMIYECRPLPGQTLDGFKPNAEIAEVRWVTIDELPKGMSGGQRRLLQVALENASNAKGVHFHPDPGDWP